MKNITIITGAYGVGKTEFAINYALKIRNETNKNIYIGDMDIINPYFRSREEEIYLKTANINILGSSLNNNTGQDIPGLSGNINMPIVNDEPLILDLAGSINGLKVLPEFESNITNKDYDFFVVVNINRPESSTEKKIIDFIKSSQMMTNLKFTGIINNSHMLNDTTIEHILHGQKICSYVSMKMNIEFAYTLLSKDLYDKMYLDISSEVITFKKLKMRKVWQ